MAAKGVAGLVALQYAAPLVDGRRYGSANVLNIRGIGRSAVDIELPQGVFLYRDGVPPFPGSFQNEPYFDIERRKPKYCAVPRDRSSVRVPAGGAYSFQRATRPERP